MVRDVTIRQADPERELDLVRQLFGEYGDSLGIDLSFQDFDRELESLPGDYAPPLGALLLALLGDEPVGCVAMRPWSPEIAEMKRLYVRPAGRGGGTGRALAAAVIERARSAGYRSMRLDTLPSMRAARALYRRLGFSEIAPYTFNPIAGTSFMELDLNPSG